MIWVCLIISGHAAEIQVSPTNPVVGGDVTFAVVGLEAETWQWTFQGVPLEGETDAELVRSNLTRADAGFYAVAATTGEEEVITLATAVEIAPPFWDTMQIDPDFDPRLEREQSGEIRAILKLPDGGFLVGGDFVNLGGFERHYLAKYTDEGLLDLSHDGWDFSGPVNTLLLGDDGTVWVGGDFSFVNGHRTGGLARLDGDTLLLQEGLLLGIGSAGPVHALALQADGGVLAAGSFYYKRDGAAGHLPLVRFAPDGELDPEFFVGSLPAAARAVVELENGQILVGGGRLGSDTESPSGFTRVLNGDGSLDSSAAEFGVGTYPGPNRAVTLIKRAANGDIFVGGRFSGFNYGDQVGHLLRYTADGDVVEGFALADAVDDSAVDIHDVYDGNPGAYLTVVGDGFAPVLLQSDGTYVADIQLSVTDIDARTVTGLEGGGGWVWGTITFANGSLQEGFAGYTDEFNADGVFACPARGTAIVGQIEAAGDEAVWIRGDFTHVNGEPARGLARLLPDGSLDETFQSEIELPLDDYGPFVLDGAGRIVVHDGETLQRLLSDGALDESFSGPSYVEAALALLPDGKLLIGNAATGGVFGSTQGILRLQADGAVDEAFNAVSVTGVVRFLVPQATGDFYAFGQFGSLNGASVSSGARLWTDGTRDYTYLAPSPGGTGDRRVASRGDGGFALSWTGNTFVRLYEPDGSWVQPNLSYSPAHSVLPLPGGGAIIFHSPSSWALVGSSQFYSRHAGSMGADPAFQIDGLDPLRSAIGPAMLEDDGGLMLAGEHLTADGEFRSGLMRLIPAEELQIVDQDTVVAIAPGGDTELSVTVSGDGDITYQWYHEGVRIEGATGATLSLEDVERSQTGEYHVVVQGPFNSVVSEPILVGGVPALPEISSPPTGGVWSSGADVELSVVATGTGDLEYQWFKDGVAIPDATAATLALEGVTQASAGYYTVQIWDDLSVVWSSSAVVEVAPTTAPAFMDLDESFQALLEAPGGQIDRMIPAGDGDFYVSGEFTRLGGVARPGLARVSSALEIDESFAPAGDIRLRILARLASGKLIVARLLPQLPNDYARWELLRLDETGSIDDTFLGDDLVRYPSTVDEQPDGRLIVLQYSGTPLLRLEADGVQDTGYAPTFGNNGSPATPVEVTVQSDGKAIYRGGFTSINGVDVASTLGVRLNLDGTYDDSFALTLGSGDLIHQLIVQTDGTLLAAGKFATEGASASEGAVVARFLADGTRDESFILIDPPGERMSGRRVVATSAGIWVAAKIDYGNDERLFLLRYDVDGDLSWQADYYGGATGTPQLGVGDSEIAVLGGGRIRADSAPFNHEGKSLLRVDALGAFVTDDQVRSEVPVAATVVVPVATGGYYVAGPFTRYNGESVAGLVRIGSDGMRDADFSVGDGFDGPIHALLAQADSTLLVGGKFTHFGETPMPYLAKLDAAGGLVDGFETAIDLQYGWVGGLQVAPHGGILVEVDSNYANLERELFLLRPDGQRDTRFNYAPVKEYEVDIRGVQFFADGDLLVQDSGSLRRLDGRGGLLAEANTGYFAMRVQADETLIGARSLGQLRITSTGYSYMAYRPLLERRGRDLALDSSISYLPLPEALWRGSSYPGPTSLLKVPALGLLANDATGLHLWGEDGTLLEAGLLGSTVIKGSGATEGEGAQVALLRDNGGLLLAGDFMQVGGYVRPGLLATVPHEFGTITEQPAATAVDAGDDVVLSVAVEGPGSYTYQWRRFGEPIAGATGATLTLSDVGVGSAGLYDVVISDGVVSQESELAQVTVTGTGPLPRSLLNLSTLVAMEVPDQVVVPFRLEGEGTKSLLLRAVGPRLASLGVSGAVANPRLRLLNDRGEEIAANDDWMDSEDAGAGVSAATDAAGAISLLVDSLDAALVAELAAGSYSLEITAPTAGTLLAELHDLGGNEDEIRLVSCGLWGRLESSSSPLNIGLTLGPGAADGVLMRGLGPGAGRTGAVLDPNLKLFGGNGTELENGTNDNWSYNDLMTSVFEMAGAPPLTPGSLDAVLLRGFDVGVVTARLGTTGYVFSSRRHASFEWYDLNARTPEQTPVVLAPPQSRTMTAGASVTLEVWAASLDTPSFQWRKNGEPLPGKTGSTLTLPDVQVGDDGSYDVVVTNGVGSITTAPATLTYVEPVQITTQPVSQEALFGANVSFTVAASGIPAPTFQWRRNGETISNATSATLQLSAVSLDSAGDYDVVVTNAGGSETSDVATLVVNRSPYLLTGLSGQSIRYGQTATFNITVQAYPEPSYQWQLNGEDILGATSSSLTITDAGPEDAGGYSVVVSNDLGSLLVHGGFLAVRVPYLTSTTRTVGPAVTRYGIGVEAESSWSASADVDWLTFTPESGGMLQGVSIEVDANDTGVVRTGTIVINGASHVVTQQPDGTGLQELFAMGRTDQGQFGQGHPFNRVDPHLIVSEGIVDAAGGEYHSLYVKADGTLWATGRNDHGQLGDGTRTERVWPVQVATGVIAVAAGGSHSLFLKSDGTAWAMGSNYYGQLGDGTNVERLTPVQVASNIVAIDAGSSHSLFLTDTGILRGTGRNGQGQLGSNSPTTVSVSQQIATNVSAMSAGGSHTLVLKSDQSLWATGSNYRGQLGDGTTESKTELIKVADEVAAIAAGYEHSLFVTNTGDLMAVGNNGWGQLGDGTNASRSTPINVATGVVGVFAGGHGTIFLTDDGRAWGMGFNYYGQLGDGTTVSPRSPIELNHAVSHVALALSHTLLIGTDDSLSVLGMASFGRLGDGSHSSFPKPVQIAANVDRVTAGSQHVAYTDQDGRLWVASPNNFGEQGRSTILKTPVPLAVASEVKSHASGSSAVFYITQDDTLWGMGYNLDGQLGDGTRINRYVAKQLQSDVRSVSSGIFHTFSIKNDGALWGAGVNSRGQLGDGTKTDRLHPVQIATEVSQVSTGFMSTMFVKSDDTLWAMGMNINGGFGDGTTTDSLTPKLIMDGVSAVHTAGGDGHTLIIKTDGTLWGVGNNNTGALGTGNTLRVVQPVEIAQDVIAAAVSRQSSLFLKSDGSLWGMGRNGDGQLSPWGTEDLLEPVLVAQHVTSFALGDTYAVWVAQTDSTPPTQAPFISQQPVGVQTIAGNSVEMSVTAQGNPSPMFQWRFNGENIEGATESTLTIASVTSSDAGDYDVVVTNADGSVISEAAVLTVLPVSRTDLNGDDRSDIVWRNSTNGEVGVWLMDGTGVGTYQVISTVSTDYVLSGTGDFNGDDQTDLLWRNSTSGEVGVWLMNGTSVGTYQAIYSLGREYVLSGTGDFNGDGQTDILLRNRATGDVGVWLMNGTSISSYQVLGTVSADYVLSGTGDFNADGSPDILWRHRASGEVGVWLMNATSVSSYQAIHTLDRNYVLSGTGDYNEDGQTDILLRHSASGEVGIWLMNGTSISSYQVISTVSTDYVLANNGEPATSTPRLDLNNDGQTDILWRNSSTGQVIVWLMDDTDLTTYAELPTTDLNYRLSGWGDFTGDGEEDLLWRHSGGEVGLWTMEGTNVTGYTVLGWVPMAYTLCGVGDLNADGYPDILWRHSSGELGVWLMNGTTVGSYQVISNVNTDYTFTGTGDFNGDGQTDILWRHTPSGEVGTWLMEGTSILRYESIGSVDPSYTITGIGDYNADGDADILWRHSSGELGVWLMSGYVPAVYEYIDSVASTWSVSQ